MAKIKRKFDYTWLNREMVGGKRMYIDAKGARLPSVTTVLSMTMPPEKREILADWFRNTGPEEAIAIKDDAARVGSVMHAMLESKIGKATPQFDEEDVEIVAQGMEMADVIWADLEPRLDEVWGIEVPLNCPGLYAGVTDLVGVIDGKPAIVDFKQSNREKKSSHIGDDYCQTAMYARAHNALFKTRIKTGHVFMCTRDLQLLHFPLKGKEFALYDRRARRRVELYHEGYRSHVDEKAIEAEMDEDDDWRAHSG